MEQIRHEIDGYTVIIENDTYTREDVYDDMAGDILFNFAAIKEEYHSTDLSLYEEYLECVAYRSKPDARTNAARFTEWGSDNGLKIVCSWPVYIIENPKLEFSNKPFPDNREASFIGFMYVTSGSLLRNFNWQTLDDEKRGLLDQLAAGFFKKHNPDSIKNFWCYRILDSDSQKVAEYRGFIEDKDGAVNAAKNCALHLAKARRESLKQSRKTSLTQRLAAYLTGFFTRAKS